MIESFVIDVFVVVEPHFGNTHRVLAHDVDAGQPLVGRTFAEYVSDVAARHREQLAAAHPYAKRDLQVLASPNVLYNYLLN